MAKKKGALAKAWLPGLDALSKSLDTIGKTGAKKAAATTYGPPVPKSLKAGVPKRAPAPSRRAPKPPSGPTGPQAPNYGYGPIPPRLVPSKNLVPDVVGPFTAQTPALRYTGSTPKQKAQQEQDLAKKVLGGELTLAQARRNAKELGLNYRKFVKSSKKDGFLLDYSKFHDTGSISTGEILHTAHKVVEGAPGFATGALNTAGKAASLVSGAPPVRVGWQHGHPTVGIERPTGAKVGQAAVEAAPAAAQAAAHAAPLIADVTKRLAYTAAAGELAAGRDVVGTTGFKPPPSGVEQHLKQEGFSSAEVKHAALQGGLVLRNIGVGLGGAVYAFRDPAGGFRHTAGDIYTMLAGPTQLGGLLLSTESPSAKGAQGMEIARGMLDSLAQQIGPNTSVTEAFKFGEQHPGFAVTNAFMVADPAVKAATLGYLLRFKGLSLGDARAALETPLTPRTLRYQTEGRALPLGGRGTPGEPLVVEIPHARSPITRQLVQRPGDAISGLVDSIPGLRRLPFAEGKRAARAKYRQMNADVRRLPATTQANLTAVQQFLKDDGEHYRTALAVALQKPKNLTLQEWNVAVLDELEQMLAGRPVQKAGGAGLTPAMQRRLSQIRRYRQKYENQLVRRRARAGRKDHDRLTGALDEINAQHQQVSAEADAMERDDSLTPQEKVQLGRQYDAQLHGLETQARVAQGELDSLTADLPVSDHPNRAQFQSTLERIPYFQKHPERVPDMVKIGDARARTEAAQTGGSVDDYWSRIESQYDPAGANIPEPAFAQTRGIDETLLNNAARSIYARYGKTPGAMPPGVKGWKGFATKSREVARLADLGKAHRGWYTDSGRAIRRDIAPSGAPLTDAQWGDAIRLAKAVAYLSRTDSVVPNVGHALRAFNEWKRSGGQDVGLAGRYPNEARAALNTIFNEQDWGGYKTNAFFRNILEEVDKGRYDAMFKGEEPVTVDRWIVRAFGHQDDSVSQKGRYLSSQEMVQHIAQQHGWTPKEAQAAVWVGIKAERSAAENLAKVTERNAKNKAAHEARVAKAKETGRGGPRKKFEPEKPRTAQSYLEESGVHVGTGIERTTHQLRLNYEAAPGNTYDGFPEFATWPREVQDQFARDIATGVHEVYFRDLGLPFSPGSEGPGIWEPVGGPIETNLGLAVNVRVGSSMRADTAAKYGLDRVSPEMRAYYDGIAAGLGRGLKQNAQPWLKPLVAENVADATATFVARPNLTKEEMLALRAARGDADWQIALSHGDGGVWLTLVKDAGMDPATFRERVATIVDEAFGADTEHNLIDYAHEGGYLENDWRNGDSDYQAAIGNSGRPDEIRRASTALTDHYERTRADYAADPAGAAERSQSRAVEQQQPGDTGPARPLAQTRRQDLLGASHWLDTPEGKRVLYFTEHADASTVVHELIGHATDDLRRFYPAQFADVEAYVGRPYADWTVADHEQFANWAERYFDSGYSPVPELTGVFDRMKTWMRTIYAGIKRTLGPQLPYETRILFDHYFGAYDDANVAKINEILTGEGWSPEDSFIQQTGGTVTNLENEAKQIRTRQETRAYNKSLDSLVTRTQQRAKRLTKLDEKGHANWTQAELDEYHHLNAQVLQGQADIVVRSDRREQQLRAKVDELTKSLEKGVDNRRFQGALDALATIAADREKILRDVFGNRFDEVFANRVDLLADWLVHHKLLSPEFDRGTATYWPMVGDPGLIKQLAHHAAPLTGGSIGKARTHLLQMYKRNEMIRWQKGDWSADPAVLMRAYMNAQSFAWMHQVKDLLHEMGRPLHAQDLEPGQLRGMTIINKDATPLGPQVKADIQRAQAHPGDASSTYSAQSVISAIEGDDNNIKEGTLKNYFDSFAIDPAHIPDGFNPLEHDVRVIPTHILETILRPLKSGTTLGGKIVDYGALAARFALIYANAPAYIIANLPANIGMILLHQGPHAIPTAMRLAARIHHDPLMRAKIEAEVGTLPAQSYSNPGRGFSDRVKHAEDTWLKGLNWVDRWPRMVAWMYEAKKAGYTTDDQLMTLLNGKTPKAAADRVRVQHFAVNHLFDFDRLTPWEKQTLSRGLFIWPFVRAATAYPFWYAKNYPGRSALLANLGNSAVERRNRMLGVGQIPGQPATPPWYEDLFPMSVNSRAGTAQVTRAGMLSPTSTASNELRLVMDEVASALGRKPDAQTAALLGQMSPMLGDMISAITHKDNYGQDVSLQDTLKQAGFDIVPGLRIGRGLAQASATPRVFRSTDANPVDRTLRNIVRINPQTVSLPWLHEQAVLHGDTTPQARINRKVAQAKSDIKWATGVPEGVPGSWHFWIRFNVTNEDAQKEYARSVEKAPSFLPTKTANGTWSTKYKLNTFEQAKVAYETLSKMAPHMVAHNGLTDPVTEAAKWGYKPGSVGANVVAAETLKQIGLLERDMKKIHGKATSVRKKVRLQKAAAAEAAGK